MHCSQTSGKSQVETRVTESFHQHHRNRESPDGGGGVGVWGCPFWLYSQISMPTLGHLDLQGPRKAKLNSNTWATWCKELTPWKSPWFWERLMARGEGDDRGWDVSMAWVWVSSRIWWWTGKPGMLQSIGSQRVGHDWETELRKAKFSSVSSPRKDSNS